MNKTLRWAFAGACLTGVLGCRLAAPRQCPPQPVSTAAYSEAADCSGLSGNDRLEETFAPQVQTQARIPYSYRWDEYQGSDIEHDIYGDRQRAASLRAMRHPHLVPDVARTLHGLLGTPGHRTCAVPCGGNCPKTAQTANQTGEFDAEKPPVPPISVPLTIAPPTPEVDPPVAEQPNVDPQTPKSIPAEPSPEVQAPAEPVPTEPTPAELEPAKRPVVPPRNLVPRPLPKSTISPSTTEPEPSAGLEQSPATPTPQAQLPDAKPKISIRLTPTLIMPAIPPSTSPDTGSSEVQGKELRRNKIPAHPPRDSTE
ncbi:MAG: hypothetical protein ACKVP0_05855 [Pirellulaceae bacterium]